MDGLCPVQYAFVATRALLTSIADRCIAMCMVIASTQAEAGYTAGIALSCSPIASSLPPLLKQPYDTPATLVQLKKSYALPYFM